MTNILPTAWTPQQKIKARVADSYDRQADEFEARNDFEMAASLRSLADRKREQIDAYDAAVAAVLTASAPTAYDLAMEKEHSR